MNNKLPADLEVPVPQTTIALHLSNIKYAVVLKTDEVVALFRWKDRAESYLKSYAHNDRIINIKTGEITDFKQGVENIKEVFPNDR